MKHIASLFNFSMLLFLLMAIGMFTPSCEKEPSPVTPPSEPPKADTTFFVIEGIEVSNGTITTLGYNTVKFQGQFKKFQASSFKIVDYGYVLSSTTNKPTFETNEGISAEGERNGVGVFDSQISDLKENKTYYARIYLKRQVISTGAIEYGYHPYAISFTTKPVTPPLIFNMDNTSIATTSLQANAIINDPNSLDIQEHGHIWSKTNPNLDLSNNDGKTNFGSLQSVFTHNFSSNITNLSPNTSYFVKAYAKNEYNLVGYSPVSTVTTNLLPPDLKVQFCRSLSGDFFVGELEKIQISIKNEGLEKSFNTIVSINHPNIEIVSGNSADFGTISSGESVSREITIRIKDFSTEQNLEVPITVSCAGAYSWNFNNVLSVIVSPKIQWDGMLAYYRFNNSQSDEISNNECLVIETPTFDTNIPGKYGTCFSYLPDGQGLLPINGFVFETPSYLKNTTPQNQSYTICFWLNTVNSTMAAPLDGCEFDLSTPGISSQFGTSNIKLQFKKEGQNPVINYVTACNSDGSGGNNTVFLPSLWIFVSLVVDKDGADQLTYASSSLSIQDLNTCFWGNDIGVFLHSAFIDNLRIYSRKLNSLELLEIKNAERK